MSNPMNDILMQAKIEERIRIAAQLRQLAQIMLTTVGNAPADGYAAAIIKGFADLIENDNTVTSTIVPPHQGSVH